jgi:hypothetical protein
VSSSDARIAHVLDSPALRRGLEQTGARIVDARAVTILVPGGVKENINFLSAVPAADVVAGFISARATLCRPASHLR